MSNKKFIKKINKLLESKKAFSLNILLEEESESTDSESTDSDSTESSEDDSSSDGAESSIDSAFADDEDDDEQTDDSESVKDEDTETKGGKETYDDIHGLARFADKLEDAKDAKDIVIDKYTTFNPDSLINIDETFFYNKMSVSDLIILNEKDENQVTKTLDRVEKTLEDEQERIDQMTDTASNLASQITGQNKPLNITKIARDANAKHEKFDSLFSKAEIVKDMYVKKIVKLSDPSTAESNVKSFIDEFNKNLDDNDKLHTQPKGNTYNNMAGAKAST